MVFNQRVRKNGATGEEREEAERESMIELSIGNELPSSLGGGEQRRAGRAEKKNCARLHKSWAEKSNGGQVFS